MFVVTTSGLIIRAPRERFEIGLDLQERFALSLRHPIIAEQSSEERGHRVYDKVSPFPVRVGDWLVYFQHDSGRERNGEYYRGVGYAAGVRREVLALDDGQQWHQPDVDEEFRAANTGQQQPADRVVRGRVIVLQLYRQQHGYEHVAQCGAHARCHEQRPSAALVHGEYERHACGNYEHSEYHGASVGRQLCVSQH